jgi:hypothetical protein
MVFFSLPTKNSHHLITASCNNLIVLGSTPEAYCEERIYMHLDSCTCEICILQREETRGTVPDLEMFLCKNLLVANWYTGTNLAKTRESHKIQQKALGVPFAMEIIITMNWCIQKKRNK